MRPLRTKHGQMYWRFAQSGDSALAESLEVAEGEISRLHADEDALIALEGWCADGV
jgi:hypothetical protein